MSKTYSIQFDPERCTACGACAVACMDQNDLAPSGPADMYRKIKTVEKGRGPEVRFDYLSVACLHCPHAPCIEVCPQGCIFKDPETGFTVYDSSECIGCRSCAAVCPVSAPVFGPDGKMRKCDGCNLLVKSGLEPACVRVCPFDALTLTER